MESAEPERMARNEAAHRSLNEAIKSGHSTVDSDEQVAFLCECGKVECDVTIPLTLPEYEAVRADGRRFAVAPGHENLAIERVVAGNERFHVVEKLGEAATVVEEMNPRSTSGSV